MNDRETIEKIIKSQRRICERNYMNYQQSGERRYERAWQKAEDLIDICTLALDHADERTKLVCLRSDIVRIGYDAIRLLHDNAFLEDTLGVERLLKELRALAKDEGVRDPYQEK